MSVHFIEVFRDFSETITSWNCSVSSECAEEDQGITFVDLLYTLAMDLSRC